MIVKYLHEGGENPRGAGLIVHVWKRKGDVHERRPG